MINYRVLKEILPFLLRLHKSATFLNVLFGYFVGNIPEVVFGEEFQVDQGPSFTVICLTIFTSSKKLLSLIETSLIL